MPLGGGGEYGPVMRSLGWIAVVLWGLVAGCQAHEERTVAYDDRYGGSTTMDLYLPAGERERPAIMMVHGGSWRHFDKDRYRAVARRLARSGFVTASINYRLVPAGAFPNAVHDVACALAYLQNHAADLHIDPARIVVMGYSAGAHLGSLVAVAPDELALWPDCDEGVPDRPAGVISGAGPMDIGGLPDVRAVREFMGGSEEERPAAYALASPVTHPSPDDPPFLFVHGAFDLFVPTGQSERMRDLLRAEGVGADLLELAGTGHLFNPTDDAAALGIALATDAPEAWIAVLDFLDRTVGRP